MHIHNQIYKPIHESKQEFIALLDPGWPANSIRFKYRLLDLKQWPNGSWCHRSWREEPVALLASIRVIFISNCDTHRNRISFINFERCWIIDSTQLVPCFRLACMVRPVTIWKAEIGPSALFNIGRWFAMASITQNRCWNANREGIVAVPKHQLLVLNLFILK